MQRLSTPEERFATLEGFDFPVVTAEVPDPTGGDPLRLSMLDTGASSSGEVVVLLHGEPTWSYLYRSMIPPLVARGHRVVAPDLIGFGRSDKPASRDEHTYARHVEWLRAALFDVAGLDGVTVFGQDWGGLIGLRLVAEQPERFKRVAMGNTGLPTGDRPPNDAFLAWQQYSQSTPSFEVGQVVSFGCARGLVAGAVAAYDAPFPDDAYKEGPRQLPMLVPTSPTDPAAAANRAAWDALGRFDRPFLCCYSDGDAITKGSDRKFLERVPGAAGQPHATIEGAGHFLQEDAGEELAEVLGEFINRA
ncbi:MAG TPA: haloalkane dehalogenase [Acidimicrobiales bacterium]|jgi:haloalkane dehalogenase|nr:haloalkane dehalogenase [Acidimicrobiales bacterium]